MMQTIREVARELRPVIIVAWILAAARLVADHVTEDPGLTWGISVYFGVFTMLLFCGMTGVLDHLLWKRALLGGVVLAVLCWFVPNTVSYTLAQFTNPGHGRFYVLPLHQELADSGEFGDFEIRAEVEKRTGKPDPTRNVPTGSSTGNKLLRGLTIGFVTTIAGALWSIAAMVLCVGIPASIRKRRGG